MKTIISSRWMPAVVLSAALASGSLLSASPASAQGYSAWRTVQYGDAVGVETNYSDGSDIVLAVVNGKLHLVLQDPAWHLYRGRSIPVMLSIDGDASESYRGTATALDQITLDIPVNNADFVVDFAEGLEADLFVLGSRWGIDLTGSAAATTSMLRRALAQ